MRDWLHWIYFALYYLVFLDLRDWLHRIYFAFYYLIFLDLRDWLHWIYFAFYYLWIWPIDYIRLFCTLLSCLFFFFRLLFELLFVCVLWLVCVSLHDNWKFGTLIRGLCIWNLDIRFNDSSPNSLLVDKPTKKDRKVRV